MIFFSQVVSSAVYSPVEPVSSALRASPTPNRDTSERAPKSKPTAKRRRSDSLHFEFGILSINVGWFYISIAFQFGYVGQCIARVWMIVFFFLSAICFFYWLNIIFMLDGGEGRYLKSLGHFKPGYVMFFGTLRVDWGRIIMFRCQCNARLLEFIFNISEYIVVWQYEALQRR